MSATGRGAERAAFDFYPTPAWCVDRLLDRVGEKVASGAWIEPAVGSGAIVHAADEWHIRRGYHVPRWTTLDVRSDVEATEHIDATLPISRSSMLALASSSQWDLWLTNPPYRLALDFAQAGLEWARCTAMLLRINWLAGEERAEWLRAKPPAVYVLPNRPSFDGVGTDATDYAWMAWGLGNGGTYEILDSTPVEERRTR